MKPVALVTCLVLAACAHGPTAAPADPTLDAGRRWTAAFYDGQTDALWDRFDDGLRRVVPSRADLGAFRARTLAQLGRETAVTDEHTAENGGARVYVRTAAFERGRAMRVSVAFDPDGRIGGFLIEPSGPPTLAPTTHGDYRTHAALHLPFAGAWTVVWGGRTLAENYHAASRDQRFAYDLVVVEHGTTHRNDGARNDDYFAYGEPILAPAAGTVVGATDGVAENVPGVMNSAQPPGNFVVIDHGDGEFSLLAHMIPGSLDVKVGDRVAAGQRIGRCGNSGNSSEPHLHYDLQSTPRFGDADGLPAQFRDYVADGRPIAVGEPIRGQTIESR